MTMQEAIQKMWEDFRLRGLSESTFRNYTRNVRQFLEFCDCPIEELDETDVRKFLSHLITDRRLAPKTVNQVSSSIRFFFAVGLNRHMNYNQIPMMKIPNTLPDILTREEIGILVDAWPRTRFAARLCDRSSRYFQSVWRIISCVTQTVPRSNESLSRDTKLPDFRVGRAYRHLRRVRF